MNGKVLGSRYVFWAVMVASLWFCAGSTRAEVGVANNGPVEHMYESRIIEDSDPVGASWRPSPVTHPRRHVLNPDGETNNDGRPSLLVGPQSGVHRDVPEGQRVVGTPQRVDRAFHRESAALTHLPALLRRVRAIERRLRSDDGDDAE